MAALVQWMAWHRTGDKPLSERMLVSFCWCPCYSISNFIPNTHYRHLIAHPWGRAMAWLLWIKVLCIFPLHYCCARCNILIIRDCVNHNETWLNLNLRIFAETVDWSLMYIKPIVTTYDDIEHRYWLGVWWHQAITWTNFELSSMGSVAFIWEQFSGKYSWYIFVR